MVGKVTRRLLEQGVFPRCLSDSFADIRELDGPNDIKSPYDRYLRNRAYERIALRFSILALLIGSVVVVGWEDDWNHELLFVLKICFVSSCLIGLSNLFGAFLSKGLRDCKDDLYGFEERLEEVIVALNYTRGSPRPPYLMSLPEVKESAREDLVFLCGKVLALQQRDGEGSAKTEAMRAQLKKTFDLFAVYGLVDQHAGYKAFFDEAKSRGLGDPIHLPDSEYYSFEEAVKRLGYDEARLRLLVSDGEIGVRNVDGQMTFCRQDVDGIVTASAASEPASKK